MITYDLVNRNIALSAEIVNHCVLFDLQLKVSKIKSRITEYYNNWCKHFHRKILKNKDRFKLNLCCDWLYNMVIYNQSEYKNINSLINKKT